MIDNSTFVYTYNVQPIVAAYDDHFSKLEAKYDSMVSHKDSMISEISELTKKYDALMASPMVRNNLELQKAAYSTKEADIQLSKDNVHLREENMKLQKEYLDLKTRTETSEDIEESGISGSISTGEITCLGITAIGLVTAAIVINDSKKRNSQKGTMYLIEKEPI